MRVLLPVQVAVLLSALAAPPAWPQQVGQPGTLPPPRPLQPQAAAPAAPRPAPEPQPVPARPAQARPAQAPAAAPPPRPTAQAAPPARRPASQPPPAVGARTPPANRRPGAAATAGAAAAGAAAGGAAGAAAASRPAPAAPAVPPSLPPPSVGQVSGLPLPRFASLRSDQVNLRVGPNTTFPIEWTFQRRDLPVQIIGEFQVWRRVRDVDGAEGWVHQSTLAGRRTVLVRPPANATEIALHGEPLAESLPVARLRAGVIARVRECEAESPWCEVQVAGHRGYIRRTEVWGLIAGEEVK
jgi:SH3-like domain-containing protein